VTTTLVLIGCGVAVLLLVIRALTRRAYHQGGAETAKKVLEVDHEKQREALRELQKDAERGAALSRRWRRRMQKPPEGD
jgi:hypothetical protein